MLDVCTKIDMHIHSCFSQTKDSDKKLVKDGTIQNKNILIKKLIDNQINMFSITDHNIFSYELYKKLKEEESNSNCIKKVLPGIEIDVGIKNKNVHIVCIFDDSDDLKTKKISEYFDGKKQLYNETEIAVILKKIGLNSILIAHQKCSPDATNQSKNLAQIGKQEFNNVINMGYLDAVEFSSEKVESVLKKYKYENNLESMIAITGSDCHVWANYPKTRLNDKDPLPTYIKSLPTFKGLVMAITDLSRISTQVKLFDKAISVDSIKINDFEVKLSKGINVIIGDNSLGKSLILNKITGTKMDPNVEKAYTKYLDNHNIDIKTTISSINYQYYKQGSIRESFESGGKKLSVDFKERFLELNKNICLYRVKKYLKEIWKIIAYNTVKNDIETELNQIVFNIPHKTSEVSQMMSVKNNLKKIIFKEEEEIYQKLANIKIEFSELLSFKGLEINDSKRIKDIVKELSEMEKKYILKYNKLIFKQNIYNSLETAVSNYNDIVIKNSGDVNKERIMFESYKTSAIKILIKAISFMKTKKNKNPIMAKIEIKERTKRFNKYKFVTYIVKNKYTQEDINAMILTLFDNRKISDIDTLLTKTDKEVENCFNANLKKVDGTIEHRFSNTVLEKFTSELEECYKIVYSNQEVDDGNSSGTNSLIFLDLKSYNTDKRIFIIDQPEDYIAQKKISTELIEVLRRISLDKQVILVTHNPQLVVNLDADNVILFKKIGNNISIDNGCLELDDGKLNILKEVAEILDGGEETIRKRWKRYEKANIRNQL